MKWLAGLDLRPDARGPTKFAAWLAGHDAHDVALVHIVERPEQTYAAVLRMHDVPEIMQLTRDSMHAVVAGAGVETEAFDTVDTVAGESPQSGLETEAVVRQADAIIVGRSTPIASAFGPRLGRVARRLLRTSPLPVMVVPPQLESAAVGNGPVVVATDLDNRSVPAVQFARTLARSFGRGIRVVHVARPAEDYGVGFFPEVARAGIVANYRAAARQRLSQWMAAHDIDGDHEVAEGNILEQLGAVADREDALAIVTGSRRLTVGERIFRSSVGSGLAARSSRPVAVVPPNR